MPPQVTIQFPSKSPIKSSTFSGGLFIDNKFVDAQKGGLISVINPSTGKEIAQVSEATSEDVDIAVKAARKAFNEVWGRKVPGHERGNLLLKLAIKIEENAEELGCLEAIDNGKSRAIATGFDVAQAAANLRYMAGWADKNSGQTIETDDSKFAYTRHEPIGVCGQVIPWNFPMLMLSWKLGPALACGNTIVLKTAEQTPLAALKVCEYIAEIFPPGVVNIISGYGKTAGAAIASHMDIDKVAFTGSTLVGRQIMKAAADSNLKNVTLELGGKSPNIIFADANMEQAVRWASFGLFFNHGQCCCAGSRIYVEAKIYDEFLKQLTEQVKKIKVGDPFEADTFQGPQVSEVQFDRINEYIKHGKDSGAEVITGGDRIGTTGYFIQPTIFANADPKSKIVAEEIFGPVVVVTKFEDEAELIRVANDTVYGLASAVFSKDVNRCIRVANALQAGTVWVNCYNQLVPQVPFGGFKQSGIGRELGAYALANYTSVKSVIVNLSEANAP